MSVTPGWRMTSAWVPPILKTPLTNELLAWMRQFPTVVEQVMLLMVLGALSRQEAPQLVAVAEVSLNRTGVPVAQHGVFDAAAALPVSRMGADHTKAPAATEALIMSRRESPLRSSTVVVGSLVSFTSSRPLFLENGPEERVQRRQNSCQADGVPARRRRAMTMRPAPRARAASPARTSGRVLAPVRERRPPTKPAPPFDGAAARSSCWPRTVSPGATPRPELSPAF